MHGLACEASFGWKSRVGSTNRVVVGATESRAMWTLAKHFLRSLIDWVFRRRSAALIVMRLGLACTALGFGAGCVLNVSVPFGTACSR